MAESPDFPIIFSPPVGSHGSSFFAETLHALGPANGPIGREQSVEMGTEIEKGAFSFGSASGMFGMARTHLEPNGEGTAGDRICLGSFCRSS